MTRSKNVVGNAQQIRSIRLTLRDEAALAYRGWVEENPNGSITIHDEHGVKTIYLKDEFKEWHFEEAETPTAARWFG